MIPIEKLARGMVCRHHSGCVYTILAVLNTHTSKKKEHPVFVHYVGANGREWCRSADAFSQKFDVLYDGTNLSSGSEQTMLALLRLAVLELEALGAATVPQQIRHFFSNIGEKRCDPS